jgi:hypothetical protein
MKKIIPYQLGGIVDKTNAIIPSTNRITAFPKDSKFYRPIKEKENGCKYHNCDESRCPEGSYENCKLYTKIQNAERLK